MKQKEGKKLITMHTPKARGGMYDIFFYWKEGDNSFRIRHLHYLN